MTALDIREAIKNRFSDHRRYAVAEEVGITTGGGCRRLDMMVLDCFYSNGFRIDGIEIKVSTSDLRRELEDPEKHIAFFNVLDYYTLAVPAGVAEPLMDIIPKKWGIMIIGENGSTRYKRKPLALEDAKADRDVPRGFLASITRSIQCFQPSEIELRNVYNKGFKEGKESEQRHMDYTREKLKRDAAKLEAYDRLEMRLRSWGTDPNEILDGMESFRKLNLDWLLQKVETCIEDLGKLKSFLTPDKSTEVAK